MKRILGSLAACALLTACDPSATAPSSSDLVAVRGEAFVKGGQIVHRVTGGGTDFPGAGIDANWSLVAMQYADGSVKGQWSDQFGHGNGGFHASVNCLEVEGNEAWISGVATSGEFAGRKWLARVRDNGRSANDPADEISFSVLTAETSQVDCHARPPLQLFPREKGQVTVD